MTLLFPSKTWLHFFIPNPSTQCWAAQGYGMTRTRCFLPAAHFPPTLLLCSSSIILPFLPHWPTPQFPLQFLTLLLVTSQPFLPFPKDVFSGLMPVRLMSSAASCSGPFGAGCVQHRSAPGLFSHRSPLQPLPTPPQTLTYSTGQRSV